jgi:hypothetical protein
LYEQNQTIVQTKPNHCSNKTKPLFEQNKTIVRTNTPNS